MVATLQVERARRELLLDVAWLETLMAMVGEQFCGHGESVCGAVVNIRNKGDKVSLWTRSINESDINRTIGCAQFSLVSLYVVNDYYSETLKSKLHLNEIIYYEAHDDAKYKQTSMIKPTLSV